MFGLRQKLYCLLFRSTAFLLDNNLLVSFAVLSWLSWLEHLIRNEEVLSSNLSESYFCSLINSTTQCFRGTVDQLNPPFACTAVRHTFCLLAL
jgi:hypothetical protein